MTITGTCLAVPAPRISRKRSRLELYGAILDLSEKCPMTLFELELRARMNFSATKISLDDLENIGLIAPVTDGSRAYYAITQKGREFLERYVVTCKLLDDRPALTDYGPIK